MVGLEDLKPKKVAQLTVPNKGDGLGGIFGEVGNFFRDRARDAGNFTDTVSRFFASKPQAPEGGGIGDFIVGRPGKGDNPMGGFLNARRAQAQARDHAQAMRERAAREEQQFEEEPGQTALSLLDFLKQAQQMGIGGGPDYSALKGELRGQASESDAKIAAIYNRLQQEIGADAGEIGKNYDQASQQLSSVGDEGIARVQGGYDAARDAQTRQLSDLGIGDAAGVLASRGGAAGADQGLASAGIAQNLAANQGQMAANRASSLQYNQTAGQVAGLEGSEQRSVLQRQLAAKLAQLEAEEQGQQSDAFGQQFSIAQALKQEQDQNMAGQAAGQQQQFENELAAQRFALDQMKAMGSKKTLQDQLGEMDTAYGVFKQMGLPEDQFSEWFKLLSR